MTADTTYPTAKEPTNAAQQAQANRRYRDSVSQISREVAADYALPPLSPSESDWIDQSEKAITALINRHNSERDGWWRKMTATLALLRQANTMLDMAESKIRAQEERIASLEELATTDELTGLKNRRGLHEAFRREMDLCARKKSRGGILIAIDLDHFKTTNDTFGHLAGDACLRLLARTVEAEIRTTDTAARVGGDEFILLLSDTDSDAAADRVLGLAKTLNNLSLAWYGNIIHVHASIGMRNFKTGERLDDVLHAADTQMYQSKSDRRAEFQFPVQQPANG